ncbi:MAG: NAD-dependent epimerase/dehydratase family protein [Bacteroidales bacterium]|nr:NAD-dependent epimerase/dehydratase family protein [Bacteroidales bacterium]
MILVTGATGLLGSHLLSELLKTHKSVRALVRDKSKLESVKKTIGLYHADAQDAFNKIEWTEGDITDLFSLTDAFKGVTQVYHTAAVVSFDRNASDLVRHVNIKGTANIVDLCLEYNIEKLCHVSSIAALGRDKHNGLVDENSPWDTHAKKSVYSKTKYEAELEVWRGIAEGLNAVIVNPAIIIGPGDWSKGSSQLFNSVYKGMKFYTTGVNGYVDVRDVAAIMHKLMESKICGERFTLLSENLSYKFILDTMAETLRVDKPRFEATPFMAGLAWRAEKVRSLINGKAPLITKETARTSQEKFFYSNQKIIDALNYTFIPMAQSINDTALIFKSQIDSSNFKN